MNLGRYTAGIAAALTTATLFTACSNGDPDTVPLGSGAPLGGPSNPNNTSVTEKSPDETAEDQAEQAVRTFYSVWNRVNTDISANIDDLNNVLGDPALKQYRGDVILRRSKGIKSEGELKVVSTDVVRIALPDSTEAPAADGKADVEVKTCVDPTAYKSTRPDGSSDVDPKAPKKVLFQYWVSNDDWPNESGWKVVGQSLPRNTPC